MRIDPEKATNAEIIKEIYEIEKECGVIRDQCLKLADMDCRERRADQHILRAYLAARVGAA